MRVFSNFWVVFLFASLLAIPSAVAQERTIDGNTAVSSDWRLDRESVQPSPPVPPLPWVRTSIRGPIPTGRIHAVTPLNGPGSPDETTVILPLSTGLSVVSLPLRVPSQKLSDIFPNLPEGSRAWIWNARDQKFVEGFDNELPLGHACWLYVPVPALVVVTGRPNLLQRVSVDLERGWNLVGVPYATALPRAMQHVYVDWTRKPFNDAVTAKEIGSLIYSLDVNGYENVAEGGSFAPLEGYWVYASGAELLELSRPGLSAIPAIAWTILGKIGEAGYSELLTQMGLSDQATLNTITANLAQIQKDQVQLGINLSKLIEASTIKILGRLSYDTYVAPVEKVLTAHYDYPVPNESLAWFMAQATPPDPPPSPPNPPVVIDKTRFADRIINEWQFNDLFLGIRNGFAPAGSKGLFEDFADQVVNDSTAGDLQHNYEAMETYFKTVVGMQIKCATLIMNAYNQLAADPTYPFHDQYPPQRTEEWKRTIFDRVIKEETAIFLNAVESIAVRKLPVPAAWGDPGTVAGWDDPATVRLPDEVNIVLGMADRFVMETLQQIDPELDPPGLRVRIILNPGADLPWIDWIPRSDWHRAPSHSTALPTFDSVADGHSFEPNKWRTLQGDKAYANWKLEDPRAFDVTRDWKVVRIILTEVPETYVVQPTGDARVWGRVNSSSVEATQLPSGTVFGSITFAARPSTREVFDPCGSWPVPAFELHEDTIACLFWDSSWARINPCNVLSFHSCNSVFSGSSVVTLKYAFVYKGLANATGHWMARGGGALPGEPPPGTFTDMSCGWPFQSRVDYQLVKGTTPACSTCSTLMRSSEFVWSPVDGWVWGLLPAEQNVQVSWEPGQTYTFQVLQKQASILAGGCVSSWTYKGVEMTFP